MRALHFNSHTVRPCYSNRSRGFFLPLLAGILFVLLALAGLAIDGSRVFLTQQRLQRAVDAGAVAAMETLKSRPASVIQQDATAYTRLNFRLAGLPTTAADSVISALVGTRLLSNGNRQNLSLDVTGQSLVPLMILSAVPGMPREMWLTANARAGIQPIAVMLVLDVSGSMGESSAGQRKIDALKVAASRFVDLLDEGDFIGITTYSDSSTNLLDSSNTVRFRVIDRLATVPGIHARIATLTPDSGTCIACGLRRAWQAFEAPTNGLPAGIPRYAVVMTDGTPEHNSTNRGTLDSAAAPGGLPGGLSCGHTRTSGIDRVYLRSNGTLATYQYSTGGPRDIYQTIAESDRTRRRGIAVISIGLGEDGRRPCDAIPAGGSLIPLPPPASGLFYGLPWQPTNCFDNRPNPPQDGYNRTDANNPDRPTVRPYLLERIANDIAIDLPSYPSSQPFAPVNVTPNPGCAGDERAGNCACLPLVGNNWPRGIYLESPTAAGLNAAFEEAFHYVKRPRLVS